LCLIPATRRAIIRYIMARAKLHTNFNAQSTQWQSKHTPQQKPEPESPKTKPPKVGRTIEGEYRRED